MMSHGLLALALLVGASPLTAQTDVTGVRAQVAAWWQDASRLAPGNWGIAVADERGEIIWSVEADQPLVPASTVKLFTTGFARSVLGSDARRATRVVGEGHLDRTTGQWNGTWALQVNGDVTLERGAGYGPSLYDLALQMHAQGIRRISGPFEVRSAEGSADATWPTAWAARHRGRLFAPLIGPLTLHENVVSFTVRPGARVGQRVRLTAAAPEGVGSLLRITAQTVAGRRSRLRFLAQPDGSWLISGTLGVRAGARQYGATASKPRVVLRAVWASALERAGIEWLEKAAPGRDPGAPIQVLAEVTSPPLDSVASEVNRRSLNIGAELLLQWAAGRGPAASAALTDHVRQVTGGDAPVHLVDGSGLSNEDRVAPSTFVSYLARFPTTAAGRNFPLLLPANGSGTLRRLSALPESGVVRAKTGTLNQVSTVVGYLGRPEGVLIVSLMYNGRKTSAARRQQWELFRMLGADGVVIPAANDSTMEANIQLGGDGAPTPGPIPGPAGD
jgi:D-alanyl-D-alanine carboxypeptidase/D-alanyl-D-alanine-endopeptidase (penicillin-binding protein 4)